MTGGRQTVTRGLQSTKTIGQIQKITSLG